MTFSIVPNWLLQIVPCKLKVYAGTLDVGHCQKAVWGNKRITVMGSVSILKLSLNECFLNYEAV